MKKEWATAHGRTFEVITLDTGPAPARKRKPRKRFTMIPGIWEEELGKAHADGSTCLVALTLLYEAWRLKSNGRKPIVRLTSQMLRRVHVDRYAKTRALRKLCALGLVGFEQAPGQNPVVSVYFLD